LISWRNIWRNRTRSLVVIGSLVVGIWALIFMVGFMNSFIIGYINGAIKNEISHIQIHHPDFKTDFDIKYVIPQGEKLADSVLQNEKVQGVSPRTIGSFQWIHLYFRLYGYFKSFLPSLQPLVSIY